MKKFLTLTLVLVMALTLAACGNSKNTPSAPSSGDGSKDTKLTIGVTGAPAPVNPLGPGGATYMTNMIYETLITIDPATQKYVPCLAKSWDWSDDNLTLTLHLRDDVNFTNGEHMTSADVMYTLTSLNAGPAASNFVCYDWNNCTTPDDFTVVLKFTKEYGPAISNLTMYDILCKSWYATATDDDFMYHPNGTGPYTLSDNVAGSYCSFVRKDADKYWGTLPECSEVTYRYYAEPSTMYIDFETGAIDAASGLSASDAASVENGNAPAGTQYVIGTMKDVLMCILPEDNPIFNDIRVREAFMISVDWDKVAKSVYGVLCIPATSTLPHDVNYYVDVGQYEYNPDRAKQLLADAGYANKRIQLRHICTTGFDVVAEAIQASVKETGFDMTIECYDPPTAIPMLQQSLSDFITKQAMSGAYTLDPDMIYDTLSPDSTLPPARQSTPEWTALFDQGLYSVDASVRADAYAGMQQYLKDQFRAAGICERALMMVWNGNKIADFPLVVADAPVVNLVTFKMSS